MAYPSVSAPSGLVAINSVDGKPYAGATRQLPIASTYNTAIFNGDIVAVVDGGTIEKSVLQMTLQLPLLTTLMVYLLVFSM